MVDRQLDPKTNDILIKNYDNPLVGDSDQVTQNVRIRLKFFAGEWFLNTSIGIPYFSDSFTKASLSTVDAIIKATIVDTPEINSLLTYTSAFDGQNRKYTINFSADTIYGPVTVNNTQAG